MIERLKFKIEAGVLVRGRVRKLLGTLFELIGRHSQGEFWYIEHRGFLDSLFTCHGYKLDDTDIDLLNDVLGIDIPKDNE